MRRHFNSETNKYEAQASEYTITINERQSMIAEKNGLAKSLAEQREIHKKQLADKDREKIHALELLGATFVDKKHDMLSAYGYWKTALERRAVYSSEVDTVTGQKVNLNKEKTVKHNPIEAYEFATEFITQAELDEIIADPDDMRMQALLIRERILGKP